MNKILREKIQEALSSVLPITLIVLVLSMTITPMQEFFRLSESSATICFFCSNTFSLGKWIHLRNQNYIPMGTEQRKSPSQTGKGIKHIFTLYKPAKHVL